MANVVATQILEDGHRNIIVKLDGVLDTSNEAVVTKVTPSSFSPLPTAFRIDAIRYSVSSQLVVRLEWHATTNVVAFSAASGQEMLWFKDTGGLQNNSGAGKNGAIDLVTTGWTSGTQTYSIELWLVKIGV
jgi:hypothetical protein